MCTMCIYVFNGESFPYTTRFWSVGICNDTDVKPLAVHDAEIQPVTVHVHPHGSERIGIIVCGSIFMADCDLSASVGWVLML